MSPLALPSDEFTRRTSSVSICPNISCQRDWPKMLVVFGSTLEMLTAPASTPDLNGEYFESRYPEPGAAPELNARKLGRISVDLRREAISSATTLPIFG